VESFISDLGNSKHLVPKEHKAGKANPSPPKWVPSPIEVTKINVDAGVARDQKSDVIAAVARLCSGEYLGASAVVISASWVPRLWQFGKVYALPMIFSFDKCV
jgi:hypothetical protein